MKKSFTLFLLFSLMCILLIALFYLYGNVHKEGFDNKKSCCLYAYYEKNDKYKNNFEYFLQNGILEDVDYYIIINGTSTVTVPERPNITVYHRENFGFDFGAYSHAIDKMNQKYDYYFFVNTSVCGPYLHDNSKKWTEYFIELFNKDDIKIVGTSINMCNYPSYKPAYADKNVGSHVQSMFFCLNREYFEYLQLFCKSGLIEREKYDELCKEINDDFKKITIKRLDTIEKQLKYIMEKLEIKIDDDDYE